MSLNWNMPADTSQVRAIAHVAQGGRGGFESRGLESAVRPRATQERMERLEAGIRSRAVAMPPNERPDEEVVQKLIEGGRSALSKLESDSLPSLTVGEAAGLEAVILTDGSRPSLLVAEGFVNLADPEVDVWQGRLQLMEASLRKVIKAVGGIRVPASRDPVGTAFVIAPGLVLTNRHVLEAIADAVGGQWVLRRPNDTVVDFIGELGNGGKTSFKVTGVRFAGPDAINGRINFQHLDLAVLIVDPESDTGFPEAIKFGRARDVVQPNHNLCAIGFPATTRLFTGDGDRPSPGTETQKVINEIFDNKFGIKRLAPGEIDLGLGEHPDDVRKWIFTHDASTLRGNSGSCVIDLAVEGTPAIGIHFGGLARDENYAHAAAALQQQLAEQNATFV